MLEERAPVCVPETTKAPASVTRIKSYRGPPMDATRAVSYWISAGRAPLARAAERLRLWARGYHRVLRVVRTFADLEDASTLARRHLAGSTFFGRQWALQGGISNSAISI